MIPFLLLAASLVLIAVGVLLRSVLRRDSIALSAHSTDLRSENIAIARERLAALDVSHASGATADADYAEERASIEAQLGHELDADPVSRASRAANIALAAVIALGVPGSAIWLYAYIGTPEAIIVADAAPEPSDVTAQVPAQVPALADLVPRLEARLAENPDDTMGWRLLGRTFVGMQEFERAVPPLQRAIELEPHDAGTHAALGEAQAMLAGGDLNGEALPSIERAVELDPRHEQSLWLLGIARQQAGRHAEAIRSLTTLRGLAASAGNTQALVTIDEYLGESRAAFGDNVAGMDSEAVAEPPPASDATTGVALRVSVSLGDAAIAATTPEQVVFVYARAAAGPPMPLAVQRLTVADLPVTLTLDESMAMIPNMTLAAFPDVVVGARVSLSGQPVAASGDWSVEIPATVGKDGADETALSLQIEDRLP